MRSEALAKWLKVIIIGVGICGLLTYMVILPRFGMYLVDQRAMLEKNLSPWMILLWASAVPCYAVLILGWKISSNIGRDESFSVENAKYLKWIAYLAMGDSIFVFVAHVIFLILDISAAVVMMVIIVIVVIGIAISTAAAALSHLVMKAAEIKEENELTI